MWCVPLVLAGAAVILASGRSAPTGDGDRQAKLPGARPVIEAARFPTLQAALDAVPAEGGVVRLPPGTFEISEPLVVRRSELLLEGAGPATHIKNVNTAGKPALVIELPAGAKKSERLWRVQLANFRLTGNPRSGHGILAVQVNEVFLTALTVGHHGGDGIRLDRCYENPRVSSCQITYNKGTGLNLPGCHDIVVSANQFEENQDALRCTDAFNLCMTGNCIDDHLGNGVVIENTYGSVLSGNMIEECKGWAVVLDRDCYGITLSANVIAHNGGGLDLRDAHGCAVSGNTFTIMQTDALRIGPDSGRITVTGNNFSNSYLGAGKVRRAAKDFAAAGMKLEGTSDVAISGNLFSSVRPKAVVVAGQPTRRVLFADNVLTDTDSDHAKLQDSVIGPVLPGAPAPPGKTPPGAPGKDAGKDNPPPTNTR
jgi:parallel beta-helix repeat protein